MRFPPLVAAAAVVLLACVSLVGAAARSHSSARTAHAMTIVDPRDPPTNASIAFPCAFSGVDYRSDRRSCSRGSTRRQRKKQMQVMQK